MEQKRWRLAAHDEAFVIQPNGLNGSVPQLIIFRHTQEMTEIYKLATPHDSHFTTPMELARPAAAAAADSDPSKTPKLGKLQVDLGIVGFLGILEIKNASFLAVIVDSDIVASLPPDCSPLGIVRPNDDSEEVLKLCAQVYPAHRLIYAINKVFLIPYHINTRSYLRYRTGCDGNSESDVLRGCSISQRRPSKPLSDYSQEMTSSNTDSSAKLRTKSQDAGSLSTVEDLLGNYFDYVCEIERSFTRRTFFYSYDYDLTTSLQQQYSKIKHLCVPQPSRETALVDQARARFMWNHHLCKPLRNASVDLGWVALCIQGSISSTFLNIHDVMVRMVLIGRRSTAKGGTRYFDRGVNKDGHVANYCESEFLSCLYRLENGAFETSSLHRKDGGWTSFVQVRGSVPLFWEQNSVGINPVPRFVGSPEGNQKAFAAHCKMLIREYGYVHCLDLLSSSKQGEAKLSEAYRLAVKDQTLGHSLLTPAETADPAWQYTPWDFHAHVQVLGFEDALRTLNTKTEIVDTLKRIKYFHSVGPKLQKGVFRTNCLDCLDRTNVVQWFLCQRQTIDFLKNSEDGRKVVSAFGAKRTQEVFAYLICQSCPESLLETFYDTVASQKVEADLGRHHWNYKKPIEIPPPFPLIAGRKLTQSLLLNSGSSIANSPEYLAFFTGRWSEERMTTTIYIPVEATPAVPIWEPSMPGSKADELVSATETPEDDGRPALEITGVPITAPATHTSGAISALSFVFKDGFSAMWADQGDLISVAYTGTGSVLTPLIRAGKSTLLTNLTHLTRTVGRFYKNTFEDKFRQECIELLLGSHKWSKVAKPVVPFLSAFDTLTSLRRNLVPRPLVPAEVSLSVWIGTWNVAGGSQLLSEDLDRWIGHPSYDLYCVCMQEIVDLTSSWKLLNQVNRPREQEAIEAVRRVLGSEYRLLAVKTLIGLHMTIFVKDSIHPEITNLDLVEVKMGFMGGQIGNKGGVAIRFDYSKRSWCFVNCHLAPDKGGDKATERLAQIAKVLSIEFLSSKTIIEDHDYLFFAGDLNFPAVATLADIERWLEQRDFVQFFSRDQLHWLRKKDSGNLFRRLNEAAVNFWPSYKYKKGSSQYDRKRPPSWCDRVLYGGRILETNPHSVEVLQYDRVRDYNSSDHKPVFLTALVNENANTGLIDLLQ